jgi:hypothetical protein
MINRTAEQLKASVLLDEMAKAAAVAIVGLWVQRTGIPVIFENLTLGQQSQLIEDQRCAIQAVFATYWNTKVEDALANAKAALKPQPRPLESA